MPDPRSAIQDIYPLSPLQHGMLVEALRRPDARLYSPQRAWRMRGHLDARAFRAAWEDVVSSHDILRASFVWEETSTPVHVIHRQLPEWFVEHDWRDLSEADREQRLAELLASNRAAGFNPADPPLLRVALVRLADEDWRIVWSYHHLLLDGWSIGLVVDDVAKAYLARVGGASSGRVARRPFRDYIAWLQTRDRDAAERFWRERLRGLSGPSRLLFESKSGETGRPFELTRHELIVDEPLRQGLIARAASERITLNTLVQACWGLLLSHYNGQDEVLFGSTTAGRPPELPEAEYMVGPFINVVPLRLRVQPSARFGPWARAFQSAVLEQSPFEWVSLVDVRRWSEIPGTPPLYDTQVAFQNFPRPAAWERSLIEPIEIPHQQQTEVPLILFVTPHPSLTLTFESTTPELHGNVLEKMARHFHAVLQQVATGETDCIGSIELLDEGERMAVSRRSPSAEAMEDLIVRFYRVAASTPAAPAIVAPSGAWSFAMLRRRVERAAAALHSGGIGPEDIVAIHLERSPELLATILGVLAAGAAFLVIDPAQPAARIQQLLDDARPALLVSERQETSRFSGRPTRWSVLTPAALLESEGQDQPAAVRTSVSPASLAYVVYTSGSTGRPKGVMVTREGLSNYLHWAVDAYRVAESDGAPWHSSLAFDMSFTSVFCPLLAGRPVFVLDEARERDGLAGLLRSQGGFSFVKLTPAHARAIGEQLGDREVPGRARHFILGGEALHARDVARLREAGDALIVNEYGPTETVVGCSASFVAPGARIDGDIPIGDPITGMELLVLDRHARPVPAGVPGELYVGGIGVARGYLGRPDLTADRFVPHPSPARPGERVYRTGDLVRRVDGALVYLGRCDAQVKISGYRVEPREVELALLAHPSVTQAAVVTTDDDRDRRTLVAYVATAAQAQGVEDMLRAHLSATLPDYMVPSHIVCLDRLPVSASGKVDRAALPRVSHGGDAGAEAPALPRDRAELEVRRIWTQVLGRDGITLRDRFLDSGGDSLKAMHVAGRIRRQLGVDVAVGDVLRYSTIETLAGHVRARAVAEGAQRDTATRPSASAVASSAGLVVLREGSGPSPLVLPHPASGSVTAYLPLLDHLPRVEYPAIGFQQLALDGRPSGDIAVEAMAARFVDELAAWRPFDRPNLVGWSFGALLAFEMAVQLTERGHPPGRVVLIDTPCPLAHPPGDRHRGVGRLLASFASALGVKPEPPVLIADVEMDDRVDEMLGAINADAQEAGTLPPDMDVSSLSEWFRAYAANMQAAADYRPRSFAGEVVVIAAASHRVARPADLGWSRCAAQVTTMTVDGDHHTMMRPPLVQGLAEALCRAGLLPAMADAAR